MPQHGLGGCSMGDVIGTESTQADDGNISICPRVQGTRRAFTALVDGEGMEGGSTGIGMNAPRLHPAPDSRRIQ